MHRLSCLLLISIGTVLYGCKSHPSEAGHDQLMGRWELTHAAVDGKATDRLRSLYFVFLPDTSVQTNILGSETNFHFTYDEQQIEQWSDPSMIYQVLAMTDSTLDLQTEIRGKTFDIYLQRAKPKTAPSSTSLGK